MDFDNQDSTRHTIINVTVAAPNESAIDDVIPSATKPTQETNATASAYGSCVATWSIWLQRAPVDDRMVVSEIGEQWSPNTEPARTALSIGNIRAMSVAAAISPAIGNMIPKVPQDVPVEKAIKPDSRNRITGSQCGLMLP